MDSVIENLLIDINKKHLEYKADYLKYSNAFREIQQDAKISWSHWYEVPQTVLNQLLMKASGFEKLFGKGTKKTAFEWMELLQEHLADEHTQPDFEVFSQDPDTGKKAFIEIMIASQQNIIAIEQRNKSISYMVEQIRNRVARSDDFVLEALTVDPAAVSNPTIEKYIHKGAQDCDEKFLSRIPKALMKKSPRPRDPSLDMLRLTMTLIAELQGKENPSIKAVEEANDLLQLVRESEDTVEAIRHHIKNRRRDRRSS